jgi:sporulation protein YlmC with PRC-barrel domain
LAADPDTRFYQLRVEVNHGWVRLLGTVPSNAIQDAVASVVARHPLVRGIIALPNVAGNASTPSRAPVQPPVRAEAIAADGTRGRVQQVIINPCNRLVTHVIVEAQRQETPASPVEKSKHIIAVDDIEAVGHKTIYLRRHDHPLYAYPEVGDADFPLPPPGWRPPYPYERGSVRWLWKADWQRQPQPFAPAAGAERRTEVETEETAVPV